MSITDFKLDALLRDVTVPSGLLERLLALPYADDAGLDDAVRDVELPEELLHAPGGHSAGRRRGTGRGPSQRAGAALNWRRPSAATPPGVPHRNGPLGTRTGHRACGSAASLWRRHLIVAVFLSLGSAVCFHG